MAIFTSNIAIKAYSYETFGGSWTDSDVRDLDWRINSSIDHYWDIKDATIDATNSWQDCVEIGCPDFDMVTSNERVFIQDYYKEASFLAATHNDPTFWDTYSKSTIEINEY